VKTEYKKISTKSQPAQDRIWKESRGAPPAPRRRWWNGTKIAQLPGWKRLEGSRARKVAEEMDAKVVSLILGYYGVADGDYVTTRRSAGYEQDAFSEPHDWRIFQYSAVVANEPQNWQSQEREVWMGEIECDPWQSW
jgi:hypothetical protein